MILRLPEKSSSFRGRPAYVRSTSEDWASPLERNLIRERTNAGLLSVRARGRLGGRPAALDKKKQKLLVKLYHDKEQSIAEILEMFHISKPTLYKIVRENLPEKKPS